MSICKTSLMIVLLSGALLSGCDNNQKQEQLEQRERAILEKEKEFAQKEADYYSLIRMRDSLMTRKDTVIIRQWPASIAGVWNSRSVCRESNCSDYVIGDQRANIWEFANDSTGLLTRVVDKNNNLVRVYNAQYDSTSIQLSFTSDSSSAKQSTISIELTSVTADLLKGIQTIKASQSCIAKFSVELTRSTNR